MVCIRVKVKISGQPYVCIVKNVGRKLLKKKKHKKNIYSGNFAAKVQNQGGGG